MKNYYDPNFYYTNASFPNTMEIVLKLKDDIDENILQSVVNTLRYRYPYFYVYIYSINNCYDLKTNPYPIKIRNSWEPSYLGSEDVNYHLVSIKYEKNKMAIEMSNSLSDINGMIPFVKSILYYYINEKYNTKIDSYGINLVNSKISENEINNPYPDEEVDNIKLSKEDNKLFDFFELKDGDNNTKAILSNNFITVDKEDINKYCENPQIVISSLLSSAINNIDNPNKNITSSIIVNNKDLLNKKENYRLAEQEIIIKYPKDENNINQICKISNDQMNLHINKENILNNVKRLKILFNSLSKIPTLEEKKRLLSLISNRKKSTISVSYIDNNSFDLMYPYLEEIYAVSDVKICDISCKIMDFNNKYYLSIIQNFSNDVYINEFIRLLEINNINYELIDRHDLRLSGINYENIKSCTRRLYK